MTSIRIQVATRIGPDNPRGARLAAAGFVALWRFFSGLGQRPAPRVKTPVQEARAVRELALSHQASDPRFAADLFAAADRHERLHGAD